MMMREILSRMIWISLLGGCVASARDPGLSPARGILLAPTTVTVGGRAYLGGVTAGPDGLVLTAQGAEAVSGASVRVYRPGLGHADGIEAKVAAAGICAQAGGRHDPGAVGRFVPSGAAEGAWVFDGACG
jgi:hypothetical protein